MGPSDGSTFRHLSSIRLVTVAYQRVKEGQTDGRTEELERCIALYTVFPKKVHPFCFHYN